MKIKTKKIYIILFFVLINMGTVFAEESIIGFWLSTGRSKSGMASILEFQNNGTQISRMSLLWDYTYQIKGDKLIKKSLNSKGNEEEIVTINFKGNKLVINLPECDSTMTLIRIDDQKDTNRGIVGKWTYSEEGLIYYFIFTSDGFLYHTLPMPGNVKNKYFIKDDKIEILKEDGKTASKWQIKEGLLTLFSKDGKEYTYKRLSPDMFFLLSNETK